VIPRLPPSLIASSQQIITGKQINAQLAKLTMISFYDPVGVGLFK
jgi:hypothetical protein